jgi:hypothetical protein
MIEIKPDDTVSHIFLTACYSLLGRGKEAREAAKKVFELDPKFSFKKYMIFISVKSKADTSRTIDALRKAGLPE